MGRTVHILRSRSNRRASGSPVHRGENVPFVSADQLARLTAGGAVAAALLFAVATPALAGSGVNVSGTWNAVYHCNVGCAGEDFPATYTLTQAPGSNVVTTGTGYTASLSGRVLTYREVGGYSFTSHLTVSANGKSMSGPLTDSNGTSGIYEWTLAGPAAPTTTTTTTAAPAAGLDLSGGWRGSLTISGKRYNEALAIANDDTATGAISGTGSGSGPDGGGGLVVAGTISSSSIAFTETSGSYTAHLVGTIKPRGGQLVAEGTFTDSAGRHGTWIEDFVDPATPVPS